MSGRVWSILLVVLLAMRAVFGAAHGATVICFGGGHDETHVHVSGCCGHDHHHGHEHGHHHDGHDHNHDHESCASILTYASCGHDSAWPMTVGVEHDVDDCGCIDVEVAVVDLNTAPRDDASAPTMTVSVLDHVVAVVSPPAALHMTPRVLLFDPGGERRLAVVRTTRLLI